MDTPWGQQLSVLWIIVAMFGFVVHSVIVALIAWMMKKDGVSRKIESINWWLGGYVLLSFVPAPGPWLNWIVLVLYGIYRANYMPGAGKKAVAGKKGAEELGENQERRGTVVIQTRNTTTDGNLTVVESPNNVDLGLSLPLQASQTVIGASVNCDLAFTKDPFMSARHSNLKKVQEPSRMGWELSDIGSANGTFVWNPAMNSGQGGLEKIDRTVLLKNGAEFVCGKTRMRLVSYIG